jgi:hypothetical protein
MEPIDEHTYFIRQTWARYLMMIWSETYIARRCLNQSFLIHLIHFTVSSSTINQGIPMVSGQNREHDVLFLIN